VSERAYQLEFEISSGEARLKVLRQELQEIQEKCEHRWGKIHHKCIVTEAHTIQFGDAPEGWRFPDMNIPGGRTNQWERKCELCCLVQKTDKLRKERKSGTIAGTSLEIEVPDFSEDKITIIRK
jgi:hypothetical protein